MNIYTKRTARHLEFYNLTSLKLVIFAYEIIDYLRSL